MSTPEEIEPGSQRRLYLKGILGVVLILLLIGQFTGGKNSDNSNSSVGTKTSDSTGSAASWVPNDFDSWDSEVAYKWVDNPTCNSYSVCAAIQVVSKRDCPNNLYAELILQDKNYVQYSYTNDSQGSLSEGSIAELTFNFESDPRFAHFKLSKISCR